MTSPRTLSAIATAAAALLTVTGAHASTLYDAGLLSFESKAQSMWGSGEAFRKADSVFVGTEWQNKTASIGGITGSANAEIVPRSIKKAATEGSWIPEQKIQIKAAVWNPAIPATSTRVCVPFTNICETVTTAAVAATIKTPAVYETIPAKWIPGIPAEWWPAQYGDTRTGATLDVRSSGKVGLQFGYAIDSGSIDATARFRATAQLPGTVKAAEFFSVNAGSIFDKGTIATQSPKVEAYINPILKLSGTMDAKVCGYLLGCTTATNVALPTINLENQRLLSIDPNSLKILPGILPDDKALAEVPISNQTLTLQGASTLTSKPVFGFNLVGPGGVTIATSMPPLVSQAKFEVATVTARVPDIATTGKATNVPVESSGRSNLLTTTIDLDALATARGLTPTLGAGVDVVNTPVFKLEVSGDLIDADAGPVLGVTQKFTFTPTLMATVEFSRGVQIRGQQGLQRSWTGEWSKLPELAIDGTTTFSPTFWLDAMLTNEFGLDLGLIGTYDLFKFGATAKAGPVDVLKFNPQSLNRLMGLGNELFETEKLSFSVHGETFDLNGFQEIAGKPFTFAMDAAGLASLASTAAVPEPSTYAMLLLGLGVLGATARRRAREQQDTATAPQR
jgi:hypothetical protein